MELILVVIIISAILYFLIKYIILGIATLLLAKGKIWSLFFLIPCMVYASVIVSFLCVSTWNCVISSPESVSIKIYIVIFNLIYIGAFLVVPIGVEKYIKKIVYGNKITP